MLQKATFFKAPAAWILRRNILVALVAITVLALGVKTPWYTLPSVLLNAFDLSIWWTNFGRVLPLCFLVVLMVQMRSEQSRQSVRIAFWLGLIITLLFPYFVMIGAPKLAYVTSSYYDQSARVAAHIDRTMPKVQAQWKQNITFSRSRPTISSPMIYARSISFFQLSSWQDFVTRGLGYNAKLFCFIGNGWGFTVIGLSISLLSLYLAVKNDSLLVLTSDLFKVFPCGLLLSIVISISLLAPSFYMFQLETLFAKGQYNQLLNLADQMEIWYPPFRDHAKFSDEVGKASYFADRPRDSLLNFSRGLERSRLGDFLQAETYFRKAVQLEPDSPLLRIYLATAILNQGIDYFNNPDKSTDLDNARPQPGNARLVGGAINYFEKVLQVLPSHLEAQYYLMLATAINNEFDRSAAIAKQLLRSQQYFQQPNLSLINQSITHMAWDSYRDGDLQLALQRYRQSIDGDTWKKLIKEEQ